MYAQVSTNEELLFELVLIGHLEHNARLRSALLDSGPDLRDQIEALVRAHVVVYATDSLLARVSNMVTGHQFARRESESLTYLDRPQRVGGGEASRPAGRVEAGAGPHAHCRRQSADHGNWRYNGR